MENAVKKFKDLELSVEEKLQPVEEKLQPVEVKEQPVEKVDPIQLDNNVTSILSEAITNAINNASVNVTGTGPNTVGAEQLDRLANVLDNAREQIISLKQANDETVTVLNDTKVDLETKINKVATDALQAVELVKNDVSIKVSSVEETARSIRSEINTESIRNQQALNTMQGDIKVVKSHLGSVRR